eukprot:COSAG06_NODE_3366_length_5447_cov_2.293942_1_plen_257_part_00
MHKSSGLGRLRTSAGLLFGSAAQERVHERAAARRSMVLLAMWFAGGWRARRVVTWRVSQGEKGTRQPTVHPTAYCTLMSACHRDPALPLTHEHYRVGQLLWTNSRGKVHIYVRLARALLRVCPGTRARGFGRGARERKQTTRTDVLDARVVCLGFSRQVSFGFRVSSRIEMTRNQVLLAALLGKRKRLLLRASCPHAPRPSPRPSFAAFPGRAHAHAHYLSLSPRHARRAHAARRPPHAPARAQFRSLSFPPPPCF